MVNKKKDKTTKQAIKKTMQRKATMLPPAKPNIPQIELPNQGTSISEFAEILGKGVEKKDVFFNRNDEVIEIGKRKRPDDSIEYLGFKELKPKRFVTLMEKYFEFFGKVQTMFGQMKIIKSMNKSIAELVFNSDVFKDKLPVVERLFTFPMPVIYNEKLTFPLEGYDKRFGSWLSFNSPIINENMGLEKAKEIIEKVFCEFCWKKEDDKDRAIAMTLTPFLKGLFRDFNVRTPLWAIIGNRPRVGKDCLAGISGMLYEGVNIEETPISTDEKISGNNSEELRKKVMACFINGRARFHSANNKGHINNAFFEQILTSLTHSDRILGTNTTRTFDNELDFSLSGNTGITFSPDLVNRTIFTHLFYDKEYANKRKFKNRDLHAWVLQNRSLILSAFFSLVKSWIDNGSIKGSVPFTSFPEWAEVCGGIMENSGYQNPAIVTEEDEIIEGLDIETEEIKKLYESCYDKYPNKWISRADLVILIKESEIFSDLNLIFDNDKKKLGHRLKKFRGRIFSDIKMIDRGLKIRGERQQYKFTHKQDLKEGQQEL
jgi:hypothetical protein